MSEYSRKFKSVLKEYDIPNTSRNPDDVQFDDETDQEAFNVDPMDSNVGFRSNNRERDKEQLLKLIKDIEGLSKQTERVSGELAKLERSYDGIIKSSKSVANIYEKLVSLTGELKAYHIDLSKQKEEMEDMEMEPDLEGEM